MTGEDLIIRCPAVKWMKDARHRLRRSEFLELVDDLVHATVSNTQRGRYVTLACYDYTAAIGWTLTQTREPVSCLKCIAEMT